MNVYAYLYDSVHLSFFVSTFNHNHSLTQLRLSEKTYLQMLREILPPETKIQMLSKLLPTTEAAMLAEIRIDAHNHLPEDRIIVIDMVRYPIKLEQLQHILTKALMSPDIPLRIMGHGLTASPAYFVCSGKYLENESAQEIANVNGFDMFIDLHDIEATMNYFSGSMVTRAFNSLNVAPNGYFIKKSANRAKMEHEYTFLSKCPSSLRQYFPQVGDFIKTTDYFGYEIELVPILDVAKNILNGNFAKQSVCTRFFDKIERYYASCPQKKVSPQQYRQVAHNVFIEKTKERVEKTFKLPLIFKLNALAQLGNWDNFEHFATSFVEHLQEDIASDTQTTLFFSHGDLFFGNMLFDTHTGVLKLIDPRGFDEGDENAAYLPALYDIAKLSHSVNGLYDSIIYKLTDVKFDAFGRPFLSSHESLLGTSFLQQRFSLMLTRLQIKEVQVRLYEASLFLSMLPLHAEDYARVSYLFIRAMELFPHKGH